MLCIARAIAQIAESTASAASCCPEACRGAAWGHKGPRAVARSVPQGEGLVLLAVEQRGRETNRCPGPIGFEAAAAVWRRRHVYVATAAVAAGRANRLARVARSPLLAGVPASVSHITESTHSHTHAGEEKRFVKGDAGRRRAWTRAGGWQDTWALPLAGNDEWVASRVEWRTRGALQDERRGCRACAYERR